MEHTKIRVAEELAEKLEQYAGDVEDGNNEPLYNDYIVDDLCDMHEILMDEGVDEGRRYQHVMLVTDKPVKLYSVVEVDRMLSGTKDKLKVMAIISAQPSLDGKMLVNFLGSKILD